MPKNIPTPDEVTAAYQKALDELSAALETMHAGNYAEAEKALEQLAGSLDDEPALVQRALTYAEICKRRQTPAPKAPETLEELYLSAVMASNDGRTEEAVRTLDQALQQDPTSPKLLYARACAWALQGNAEAAVADLRQAIHGDPTIRFQAVNDSDFSQIREEPAFIDIIEPTPTGA